MKNRPPIRYFRDGTHVFQPIKLEGGAYLCVRARINPGRGRGKPCQIKVEKTSDDPESPASFLGLKGGTLTSVPFWHIDGDFHPATKLRAEIRVPRLLREIRPGDML